MITNLTYDALTFLRSHEGFLPETEYPFDFTRIEMLIESNYILPITLVPPGKESEYPNGLVGYKLTAKGEDAILQFEVDQQKQGKNPTKGKHNYLKKILVGFITLIVVPVLAELLVKLIFLLLGI